MDLFVNIVKLGVRDFLSATHEPGYCAVYLSKRSDYELNKSSKMTR